MTDGKVLCSALGMRTRGSGLVGAVGLVAVLTLGLAACEVIDPAIGVTTAPVTSRVVVTRATFEGHTTYSYLPANPVGVVWVFHGSGGSADFATKVETTDVLNTLTARGYGFVATDSTQRTGEKRWDVDHTTVGHQPRRRSARAPAPARGRRRARSRPTTPMYGIGMSNGSSFVSLWAEALKRDGYPVKAVAKYMAGVPFVVKVDTGVTTPTQMVLAVNDTIVNPSKQRRDLADIQASGIHGRLDEIRERAVLPARLLRVPGITATDRRGGGGCLPERRRHRQRRQPHRSRR